MMMIMIMLYLGEFQRTILFLIVLCVKRKVLEFAGGPGGIACFVF